MKDLKYEHQSTSPLWGRVKVNFREGYRKPNIYFNNSSCYQVFSSNSQKLSLWCKKNHSSLKAVTNNLEVSHNETEAEDLNIVNVNFRIINFREVHFNRTILNTATMANPTFREIKQIATEADAMARVLSNLEDMVMVGPIIRIAMKHINISITRMTHK